MDRVRIRTTHSGVNRADLLQRDGDYRPPPGESAVPGLECAGRVEADPTGTFAPGSEVCTLLGSGGYGTWVDADPGLVLDASDIDPAIAAVLPEALATAWWNLVALGAVTPGARVLVTGANSGVGHLAVQAARELGAIPIALVRDPQWIEPLMALGAESVLVMPVADGPLPEVDVIMDLVGGAEVARIASTSLAARGRWLSVGLLGGSTVEIDLRSVIRRRLVLTGSSLRSLTSEERRRAMAGVRHDLWPAVRAGRIAPAIAGTYDIADIDGAQRRMEHGGLMGKLVLEHPAA